MDGREAGKGGKEIEEGESKSSAFGFLRFEEKKGGGEKEKACRVGRERRERKKEARR